MKLLAGVLCFTLFIMAQAFAAETPGSSAAKTTGEQYLENFLTNTRTLHADFHQILRTNDGEVLQETEGVFYLNRPGKFRWNYRSPYEQVIVSDGKRIWIYDVDLKQVTVQSQQASLPNTPMALLEDSFSLHQSFNVTPLDNRDGIYRLKLESKTGNADFGVIVVGVDADSLRFMQLHDQFQQVTDIVFSNIETNIELDADVFRFVPPEGVDVFGG
jgi:outer membrane lipoprotein carrier protein